MLAEPVQFALKLIHVILSLFQCVGANELFEFGGDSAKFVGRHVGGGALDLVSRRRGRGRVPFLDAVRQIQHILADRCVKLGQGFCRNLAVSHAALLQRGQIDGRGLRGSGEWGAACGERGRTGRREWRAAGGFLCGR